MKDIEARIQLLSPSPGDLIIVTLPPDTPDSMGEEMARRLGDCAQAGGYSTIITTFPLEAERLSSVEGHKLLKGLEKALTARPDPDDLRTKEN